MFTFSTASLLSTGLVLTFENLLKHEKFFIYMYTATLSLGSLKKLRNGKYANLYSNQPDASACHKQARRTPNPSLLKR